MTDRCPTCPMPPGVPCLALADTCELIALDCGARARFLAIAAGSPPGPAAPATTDDTWAWIRLIGHCPYRSTWPGCGCTPRCALRGSGVGYHDCRPCLERYPEERP